MGQIRELCDIAKPDVAVVTNVGETHMELLGSMENIARAKSELVEDLTQEQLAVLNADNEYVAAMADKTKAQVVTYGYSGKATFRGDNVVTTAHGSVFTCIDSRSGDRNKEVVFSGVYRNAYSNEQRNNKENRIEQKEEWIYYQ